MLVAFVSSLVFLTASLRGLKASSTGEISRSQGRSQPAAIISREKHLTEFDSIQFKTATIALVGLFLSGIGLWVYLKVA
jgi:hypothetical protein